MKRNPCDRQNEFGRARARERVWCVCVYALTVVWRTGGRRKETEKIGKVRKEPAIDPLQTERSR